MRDDRFVYFEITRHELAETMEQLGIRPRVVPLPLSSEELADSPVTYYCAFCARSHREVKQLVMGPPVCICDECVFLAAQLLKIGAGSA